MNPRPMIAALAGAALMAASPLPFASASQDPLVALDDALVTGLMEQHAVPGLALAVVRGGEVHSAAWGVLHAGRDARVQDTTVFQAASLTKPSFAGVVMQLVRDGVLDLDRPIVEYLAEPPSTPATPPGVERITPRMALAHTGGLGNFNVAADAPLRFAPGEGWGYSGRGYALLQAAVMQITGLRFGELMGRRLLGPLRMESSGFDIGAGGSAIASGHDPQGRPLPAETWPVRLVDEVGAAGLLLTTAQDYARFLLDALRQVRGEGSLGDLGPLMFQPFVEVSSELGLSWGLGWALEEHDGEVHPFHWGSNAGYKSFALLLPARDTALVVLTNGDQGLELMDDLVAAITGQGHRLFEFYLLHPDD